MCLLLLPNIFSLNLHLITCSDPSQLGIGFSFLRPRFSAANKQLRTALECLQPLNIVAARYEICPESIGPTFISPRHSVRANSAGHERQQ